jgi:gamma-butyrobetaine dioxygenase
VSAIEPEPDSVDGLLELYERRGDEHLGEAVTQLQHALQAGALASSAGAGDALVAAAILHDVGHLAADARSPGSGDGAGDDRHDARGARLLASIFGPDVAAPVALHVVAKRWSCAVEPSYLEALSAASVASLAAQGGPLDAASCARFEAHLAFRDAIALRGFDDAAKDPDVVVGTLSEFEPLLRRLADARAELPPG